MAVITLSRQYGSGGDEIAVRVCEMLNYRYFDKTLMAELVSRVNLAPEDIVDYGEDRYKRTFLDRLQGWTSVRTLTEVGLLTQGGPRKVEEMAPLEENMAVGMVHAAIEAVYERGDAVIVGRGGQAILQDRPGVIHVRIQAPLDVRAGRVAEQEKLTMTAARDLLRRRDRHAADYVKRFYGVDWDDPMLYHLVINTAKCDLAAAIKIIVDATGCLIATPASLAIVATDTETKAPEAATQVTDKSSRVTNKAK